MWKDKVTMEEYDASLRGTVNAYYAHAMADPEMSREEAIASTAQVAEQYLSAVEEFQEGNETVEEAGQGASNIDQESPDLDDGLDGEDCEDGLDL